MWRKHAFEYQIKYLHSVKKILEEAKYSASPVMHLLFMQRPTFYDKLARAPWIPHTQHNPAAAHALRI